MTTKACEKALAKYAQQTISIQAMDGDMSGNLDAWEEAAFRAGWNARDKEKV